MRARDAWRPDDEPAEMATTNVGVRWDDRLEVVTLGIGERLFLVMPADEFIRLSGDLHRVGQDLAGLIERRGR